ncbi:MAG TPA: hypothetical protein VIG32_06565 [Candidatus Baltobacteraceae bacterium]|jgi:predicted amidophosphoribosyltransferase
MFATMLDLLFPPQCASCATIGSGLCLRCAPAMPPISHALPTLTVHALGPYEGAWRSAVLALKDGRRDVAGALGERLASLSCAQYALVAVPTTSARRAQRGFDGGEMLARTAARISGATLLEGLVQVAGDAQRGRRRPERLAARGRFEWRGRPLEGRRVVLVDDVVTTGATLEDCAATVRTAGGVVYQAIVVARAA